MSAGESEKDCEQISFWRTDHRSARYGSAVRRFYSDLASPGRHVITAALLRALWERRTLSVTRKRVRSSHHQARKFRLR